MLQPLQLEDVSRRYATQIAELRDFLSKAALSLDTPETLADLTARLRQDSAFHRDLTSHVWVALDSSDPPASHADLLAMLAVAAAGTSYAAAADAQDAHALLRFLIEARRSFEGVPAATSAAPQPRPVLWAPNPPPTPVRSFGGSFAETESPAVAKDRGRWLGWVVAACLLVLLLGGLWWYQRGAVRPGLAALQPSATGAALPQPATPAPAATQAKLSAAAAHAGLTANNRQYFARPARGVAEPGNPSFPTPAEPAAAAQPPARVASRHSRPVPSVPNSGLVPAVQPVSILPSTDSAPTASAPARGGTVHPTSLGIMAANVLYSPAPAYPPAASAAHVQGEVKVEAEVDPDGNVASARVISGPPLLREAAVDAVAHWHYRPYVAEGRPTTTLALVVMDFKLP